MDVRLIDVLRTLIYKIFMGKKNNFFDDFFIYFHKSDVKTF